MRCALLPLDGFSRQGMGGGCDVFSDWRLGDCKLSSSEVERFVCCRSWLLSGHRWGWLSMLWGSSQNDSVARAVMA